ncbi:GntR family transcriptional regulator [Ponticoccus sp. SC2-23]|uniref:GntR family transcriptional regulator n=1 Tax=Alexandriicola marinus TaxID=2081710 RepID=UPI000FDC3BDB|nr:GntR family transcriptional regulator [Alexandriicola marinus]MBM1218595.1 GntR family transcriptional regulator [Ponticoccus sp. SC6-9]MBM1224333.1 GntR family transcriptional regulator [Ponticoccus sp. SC6-15]MBM1229888.1 GntR family transcriptional regulator [Ponticoccus sp. SC6-38]MBM1233299.1 GntR family transcriptional regulator [Ponticoccus sp. SC6-45]MBM1236751.1 GntR family transcriptional regulator [Ponticoccus sp. SC6-49]MBM1242310.1 GntR family transcriptional regulator [Pontic
MQLATIRDALAARRPDQALHQEVRDILARLIETGALAPGDRLPSERQLTDLSGMSRVTIRKALTTLAEQGLVEQRQGAGTFVAATKTNQRAIMPVVSLSDELRDKGQVSRTIWLHREITRASYREMTVLELAEPERIARLERLRLVDERPLSTERSLFRTSALPDLSTLDQSVYAVLADRGTLPVRVVQSVTAVNMAPREAARLQALPAAAALRLTRTGYDTQGAIIEFTEALFRPDAYKMVLEFGG